TAAPRRIDRQSRRLVDHDRFRVDEEDAIREHQPAPANSLPHAQTVRIWDSAVGRFVTPLQQTKESSRLGNINLFPSDLEWLMRASRPLRGRNAFGRERGDQQCA